MAELTEAQIKLEQERLQLIQDQNIAAKDLSSTYEKMRKSSIGLNSEEKEILNISKQLSNVSSIIEKSINTRLSRTASVKDLTKQLNSLTINQLNTNNELQKLQTKYLTKLRLTSKSKAEQAALSIKQEQAEEALGQKSSRVANLQNTIRTYQEQAINAQSRGNRGEVIRLNNLKRRSTLLLAIAKDQERAYKEDYKNTTKDLNKSKLKSDELENQTKTIVEAVKAYKETISQQQEEIDKTKEAIKEKKKESALGVLKEKFNVKQIADMFTLKGIMLLIIEAALRFNALSIQIGKSTGYGADQADRVATNLKNIAEGSGNLNVTLKNLGAAMSELNDTTGGVAKYSADTLKTQIMLTKQFGLTGEEAAGIYKMSVLTGKSSSEVNDQMVAAFANTRNAVKGSADFKKTMAEASKVSGELSFNLKNNPALITEAIVKTQALGTTLEQTKNQGSQLLDFESSISNELEAELMTGQQINLEKARMYALTGDMVGLSQELANQGMTINKFENMNVLARQSYAKSLGLTSDQLADQLKKQKIAQEQGKSLAEITADEAKEAEKRQNVQDKFNAAIEKLQDFFGNLVAGPVGQLLESLTNIVELVSIGLSPLFTGLSIIVDNIVGGLKSVLPIIEGIGVGMGVWWLASNGIALANTISSEAMLTQLSSLGPMIIAAWDFAAAATEAAIAEIAGASALTLGIGTVAVIAGMVAAVAAFKAQKAGDMISPADGKTQVSTKEGGLFELSSNDDLMAGPGLAKGGKGGSSISGGNISIDLTPMINAINSVKASVDKLYAKEGVVNIDGKKVGTLLTQGSYKTA
jgi:hypothetical protein